MSDEIAMALRRVEVVNAYGLQMRPAGKFVSLANSFRSEVWVEYRGERVSGKSILNMTSPTKLNIRPHSSDEVNG
jgi:phosphotransferase system HPr (HPr) family protein